MSKTFGEIPENTAFYPVGDYLHTDEIHIKLAPGFGEGDERYMNYVRYDADLEMEVMGKLSDDTLVIPTIWNGSWVHCEKCGEKLPQPAAIHKLERYYDWDNPDSDVQGSILMSRDVYTCRNTQTCRENRRAMVTVQREIDRWADMEACEEGRGGRIGGGV
jgi:hypothetical protein